MTVRRRAAKAVSVLALTMPAVLGGLAVGAAPAGASADSCGTGYGFLESYPIKGLDDGVTGGYVSVYYNGSTGKNCAIARPISAWSGKVSHIEVQLSADGHPGYVQDGRDQNYHYYAGPIYIPARGKCINVGGFFDYRGQKYAGTAWRVHCD
jgi:hypothetical protein